MVIKLILDLLNIGEKSKIRSMLRLFREKQITLFASALAFQSLMVIVPLFILLFWYLKAIGLTGEWAIKLQEFILTHLNVKSGEQFTYYFEQIIGNASGKSWGILSLVVFIYSVVSLLYRVGDTFDEILRVPGEAKVDWKNSFILLGHRFLVLLSVPLFLIISSAIKTWVTQSAHLSKIFEIPLIGPWLGFPLSYVLDIGAIFIVYQYFPHKKIRKRSSLKAAVIITIALSLGRWMINTYGAYAFTTHKLYGVASAFILLLLWLQFAWVIFLGGLRLLEVKTREYP